MLSGTGDVSHIDFGFLFGQAPGKDKVPHTNFSFERAAFKLTSEMVDVMGGVNGSLYKEYIQWMVEGFIELKKHEKTLIVMVEIMGHKSNFPCFRQPGGGVKRVKRELEARFLPRCDTDAKVAAKIKKLTRKALDHKGTLFYEWFQYKTNGYYPIY